MTDAWQYGADGSVFDLGDGGTRAQVRGALSCEVHVASDRFRWR